MVEATQGANGRVFISYSRKDKAFVQKLNDALDHAGVQAWVDWETYFGEEGYRPICPDLPVPK